MDLLWINAADNSYMDAQTIPIDSTGYELGLLIVNEQNSGTRSGKTRETKIIIKNGGEYIFSFLEQPNNSNPRLRRFIWNDEGLVFGKGYFGTYENTSSAVPQYLYGIKGVTINQ